MDMGSEEAPPAEPGATAGTDTTPAPDGQTGAGTPATSRARDRSTKPNMLPGRDRRRFGLERIVVRLVATLGIVGIGVALGAILAASNVQGWIIGLVVAGVSVI